MEQKDFNDAVLNYVIHIADNQTRITEAMVTLGQQMVTISTQNQAIASILERVTQTTDRTEQMVARILAGAAPDKVSH